MKQHKSFINIIRQALYALIAALVALLFLRSAIPARSQGNALQPVAFVKKFQQTVNGLPMTVPYLYVMNSDTSRLRRVPNSAFFEEPAFSPLADRIAVRALTDGGNVILLVNPTTGQATQATANIFAGGLPTTTVHDPALSRDGRYLAFTKALRGTICGSDPECKHFLAYVDLNNINLTTAPLGIQVPNQIPPGMIDAEHDVQDPDWGPGGWIVYAEFGDLGLDGDLNEHGLWRIRLGDAAPQQVTSSPTNYFDYNLWANITQFDYNPTFSPDGTRIAYVKWLTVAPTIGPQTQYYRIYIINADGTGAPGTRIFSLTVNHIYPLTYGESIYHLTWSPVGTQLLFNVAASYDTYGFVNAANLCRISVNVVDQTTANCAWLTSDNNGWYPSWGQVDTVPAPVLLGIAPGQQVKGVVPLILQAADGGAFPAGMRLYDNGVLIGQRIQAPLYALLPADVITDTLTVNWNTTAVSDGSHTLRAEADDTTGHTGTISVSVSVRNSATNIYLPLVLRNLGGP